MSVMSSEQRDEFMTAMNAGDLKTAAAIRAEFWIASAAEKVANGSSSVMDGKWAGIMSEIAGLP